MASCDFQTLLDNAACFDCLTPRQLALVQTQLLCEIVSNGGGGGTSCLLCGIVDPTATPSCDCALYYNTATGSFWYWDATLVKWVILIGG